MKSLYNRDMNILNLNYNTEVNNSMNTSPVISPRISRKRLSPQIKMSDHLLSSIDNNT